MLRFRPAIGYWLAILSSGLTIGSAAASWTNNIHIQPWYVLGPVIFSVVFVTGLLLDRLRTIRVTVRSAVAFGLVASGSYLASTGSVTTSILLSTGWALAGLASLLLADWAARGPSR